MLRFRYRWETVGVTHDRQLSVVLHGLGLEALEHVGDVDRQRNVRCHAALSSFNIAPSQSTQYS